MKRVVIVLLMVVLMVSACSFAAASQTKKHPKAGVAKTTLSESYAKTALLALKAIETDDTVPHIENGKPLGDANTIAAIDAAGAKAQKPPEISATAALNAIYNDKLLDNDRRNTKKMTFESDSGLEDEGSREMTAQQRMQSDAELIGMDEAEKACFAGMETMFQSQSFSLPATCNTWSPALKTLQNSK